MPVLSRIYEPAEFGVLAVVAGIIATVAVSACLRFDVAVALPESDTDAFELLALSLLAAALVTLCVASSVPLVSAWIADLTDKPTFMSVAWLIPIGVFSTATCSALQSWNIRQRSFGLVARVRIGQSVASAATQIGLGLGGLGSAGLILGNVLNSAVAVVYFGLRLARRIPELVRRTSWSDMWRLAKRYRRFPVYSTWEALANSAAIQVPVILIAVVATTAEAGYLMLAMYVMQAPMSLIGSAIGQVYLSQAPQSHRDGQLASFTVDVLLKLSAVGVGPLIAIGILGPFGFEIIFGADWKRAGLLVAWMTPWFILQFLSTPVSMALHIVGRQRSAMVMQLFALVARVLSVWLASSWWVGAVPEAYSISGAVVYATYFVLVVSAAGISARQLGGIAVQSVKWALPWTIGAFLLLWVAESLVVAG
jgi:O-antigen/teichoic acid export membrane protein